MLLPRTLAEGIDPDTLEEIIVDEEALTSNRIKVTREGDVVIKLTTPYDAAYITEEFVGLVITSHCVLIWNLNPDEIDDRYLAYVLYSPYGKDCLSSRTSGTASSMLKVRDIMGFPIPMLPLEEQELLEDLYLAFCRRKSVLKQMLANEDAVQGTLII